MKPKKQKEHYIPDLDMVYPEKPDDRMVKFEVLQDVKINENYQFLEKSFKHKFGRVFMYGVIFFIARLLSLLRFGFIVKGRKNLRKHKKLLKDGAMTICNHVQRWDFLYSMIAIRYRMVYFPVWKEQFKSPDAWLIRLVGGIPIPDDIPTMKLYAKAFDEIRAKKKWIHAYPESSRFDYFPWIRPFKKGVFTMAHNYSLPVLPLAISWRKPFPFTLDNIPRLFAGKKLLPLITISVGEPLLFDTNIGRKEAIQKMRKDCHEAVVRLAGIKNNPYPAEGD